MISILQKKYQQEFSNSDKDAFERLFPDLSYQVENERLIVEVKDSQVKNNIFNNFEMIFFEEVEESIEEILYEVINDD